jgi:3-oxoacyl-[acyl-carrier-protein] synthase II
VNGPAGHRVVVTGIGAVTPIGTGVETFWTRLLAGVSGVGPIQAFDASRLRVRIAAEIQDFDPTDWMPRKEAKRLDRFCHFSLAAADLAMADAKLAGIDRTTAATLVGTAIGGAATMIEGVHVDLDRPQAVSPFFVPNSIANMASATIARRHEFGGPSGSPVTACASSADAIGQGYRLVRDGYAAACLAGGSEACIASCLVAGFANLRALSVRNDEPQLTPRPFDAGRDGFVMAEGAGILLLEPAETACSRGARIYAEVCGYGQANDVFHVTAPDPEGEGAARAMRAALRESGLDATRVDYVNAHGTGTRLSDAAETAALKLAFGDHSRRLAVSSTKSMTGHMLGAAGAVEAAACVLAIDRGWVPPTINYRVPDPECDLDYVTTAARQRQVDVAMSNSLAFGGHNVSLVFRRFAGE